MNDPSLKLTAYFGERKRGESGRLLADELLELYAAHRVRTSLLLRGVAGFGLKHHLRTDQLLTLSEDLPAVAVAVDSAQRIDALLGELLALKREGLVTLERARLLTGDLSAAVELPEASKLTVYVGRRERASGRPAFDAVCELFHRRGLAGATVLMGVDGTKQGRRQRASFVGANASVPMMIIAIGTGEQVAGVLAELGELLVHPVVTVERVRVCKRDGQLLARPQELPGRDAHGLALWQKLMVHTSEAARHGRRPLHRELVERLRESDVAGATSLRGIWGFHGAHAPHGDKLLQVYRHTPVVTIVVDTPERIGAAFEIIDALTPEGGLVTSEMVPAARAVSAGHVRGGTRLAKHEF
ncbi:MAG: DUF190 domain-containing protein [Solirubrobacterales bacterium]|nr:DUF190 domain-containing protein [Solirubrobacterales bacterium]